MIIPEKTSVETVPIDRSPIPARIERLKAAYEREALRAAEETKQRGLQVTSVSRGPTATPQGSLKPSPKSNSTDSHAVGPASIPPPTAGAEDLMRPRRRTAATAMRLNAA